MNDFEIMQEGAVTKVWFKNFSKDFYQKFLITGDRHHDSLWCNRELELRHLEEAKRAEAMIIDVGDLVDAMQGRFDPRRSYADLRPEYKVPAYYDAITKDAIKFYSPFTQNFLVFGRGNHDNAVLKNASTDILANLVYELNKKRTTPITVGGYGGWIILHFESKTGGNRSSIRIKYFHGAGGEAPVTRGVIQTNRQMVYLPDADVIINGHNHNEYIMNVKRERITPQGGQYFDICTHVRVAGYKNDYDNGTAGWEVERGGVPKPQGCAWLEIGADHSAKKVIVKKAYADVI